MREFKTIPYFDVKSAKKGRVRTGIASVFGHIDATNDRLHPGAFTKTITEGRNRVKHLWNHDFGGLPTATIKDIKEVGRDDLPKEVFEYAPDASGGLLVSREYHEDEFSDMILKRIDAGDITEMSFGFDVKRHEITTDGEGDDAKSIRELKEVALYDTSDVLWGMNDATVAAFAKHYQVARPMGAIVQELVLAVHNIKAGRRNNAQDLALIDQLHQISLDLGCEKCILVDTGEKSSSNDNAKSGEAESVITDNSLLANELKLNDLRLSQFLRSEYYVSAERQTSGIKG